MSVSRLIALLALLAILAGCVAPESGAPMAVSPGSDTVTRTTEQNGRFIALVGPHRQFAEPFLGVPLTNFWALRSWIDTRIGQRVSQLYVEDSYSGAERNYEAARDAEGGVLRFVAISKNEISCTSGCSYAEEFAADLPEALLRSHPQGLTVIFLANAGPELTIAVPGELIRQQIAAIDAAATAGPAAAAK